MLEDAFKECQRISSITATTLNLKFKFFRCHIDAKSNQKKPVVSDFQTANIKIPSDNDFAIVLSECLTRDVSRSPWPENSSFPTDKCFHLKKSQSIMRAKQHRRVWLLPILHASNTRQLHEIASHNSKCNYVVKGSFIQFSISTLSVGEWNSDMDGLTSLQAHHHTTCWCNES